MQGQQNRKKLKSTVNLNCMQTDGKVTQGEQIVSETNRLVTKQRRNAFRKFRSSKVLGPCNIGLQKSTGLYIQVQNDATNWVTNIEHYFLGQPTKDWRWQHQRKPRSLPSVVRRYGHTQTETTSHAILLFALQG